MSEKMDALEVGIFQNELLGINASRKIQYTSPGGLFEREVRLWLRISKGTPSIN